MTNDGYADRISLDDDGDTTELPYLGKREPTCNLTMPHDNQHDSPQGCPPNCPTRTKEDKQWPPNTMETK